jgi:hypothetical protein
MKQQAGRGRLTPFQAVSRVRASGKLLFIDVDFIKNIQQNIGGLPRIPAPKGITGNGGLK